MSDQPRWPRGAPPDEEGHGQGGRFAPVGTPGVGGWVAQVAGRLQRGWANDEHSRAELERMAAAATAGFDALAPGIKTEALGGETASTIRIDLPDGRSVVYKAFDQQAQDWDDYDPGDLDDAELGTDREPTPGDVAGARAEWVASRVAEAVGALVPPVAYDPQWGGAVWMGHIDGESGWQHNEAMNDDMWRLGLLDFLISNEDRHPGNWISAADGRIWGIDHSVASTLGSGQGEGGGTPLPPASIDELGVPLDDWRRHWYSRLRWSGGTPDVELGPNPFHPDDFRLVRSRLERLHQQGVLAYEEVAFMRGVLDLLAPHATGTHRLIP